MSQSRSRKTVEKIASIIGNQLLASTIAASMSVALARSFVHLIAGKTEWSIFKKSLNAAIRDIEEHPRGKLFRHLIEYGPHNPDDPKAPTSDGETTLSDPECGLCVEFIYSHMVNRFKGELAEILALEPCIELVRRLQEERRLPLAANLYWSEMVQERRRTRKRSGRRGTHWGNFTKGADGLITGQTGAHRLRLRNRLCIYGVVEVKSMTLPRKKVLEQIDHHITRLSGGATLGGREYTPDHIRVDGINLIRIMVSPSTWKLSREWKSVRAARGERELIFPEPSEPPMKTRTEELGHGIWQITLAWSEEALNQAAYEMTFWYMSQVGRHVYKGKNLPREWGHMTSEEAGYNAVKMMLYYMPLRYISKRQQRLAVRLYNTYSFGYALGIDSKEMLWPNDFPDTG